MIKAKMKIMGLSLRISKVAAPLIDLYHYSIISRQIRIEQSTQI